MRRLSAFVISLSVLMPVLGCKEEPLTHEQYRKVMLDVKFNYFYDYYRSTGKETTATPPRFDKVRAAILRMVKDKCKDNEVSFASFNQATGSTED